jgi:PAS domain S-box-containing protein
MESEKSWSKFINWFISRPKTTGLLVFLILTLIVSFIVLQQFLIAKEVKYDDMSNKLHVIHQNIEQSLKNCYTSTLTLALTINDEGIPEDFDNIGKKLIESNPSLSAVQLVPNGIIKYIYPLEGNEAAMGLNILESKSHNKEALKSLSTQKMYFAGPFNLKQGGVGIVGRLPVYNKNLFWGFSAVVIKLESLLKVSGINSLDNSEYYFQFSKKNPSTLEEIFFLPEKVALTDNNYVYSVVPDGDFKLYLISKNPNSFYSSLVAPTILGLVLAALFGLLTTLILKKPAELQLLVNEQTEKLLKSERKFKTIFEQAAIGISNVNPITGQYLEVNNQLCTLLGYSEQELKTKTYQSITHPEDLINDHSNLVKIKDGEMRDYSMQKRYITKSGAIVWVNLSVSPLWQKGEQPTSNIAVIEDITLRKQAEELIKKSENHFKSLFEDSPLPLREEDFSEVKKYLQQLNLIGKSEETVRKYLIDNPQVVHKCHSYIKLINVNKACFNLYKVENLEELLNTKSELFTSKFLTDFTEHLIAITQNKTKYSLDTLIKNSENEFRNIDLRWNVIRGYEDSLERIIVSNEDITERKKQENIIISSQVRIESLINTIDGIVWECDAETFAFTFISKKVESILGYSADEWLSSPTFWADHIYSDDKESVMSFCSEQTEKKLDHDFEYRMIAKNGSIVWLRDIVNVIIKDDQVVSLRGIMIDITKTKEVARDLNSSFNLVSEQNKRLLNFSYIVSHNLRSHTSNITSLTTLIESSTSEEEREEMIQLLKSVSKSLNETLYNLNEVVNIQNNIGLVTENLNLESYVNSALQLLSEQINTKKANIVSSISSEVEVNYNAAYLESILFNIISNAVRYNHPDRKPMITISNYFEKGMQVLEISDNGIGIDLKRYGSKVFGMYKTFSDNPDSKGIGLFITKNQIEAMGGSIVIKSEPEVGTTFKIYIS